MTISLILTAFLFDFPIMQYQTYNQDGAMKGGEGIVYEKEQYSELSVTLTKEYITETILAEQRLFENPDHLGYDGNNPFWIGCGLLE